LDANAVRNLATRPLDEAAQPSGWPLLDAHLPDGGWPLAGLVELLVPWQGMGTPVDATWCVLAPWLVRAAAHPTRPTGRALLCLNPTHEPYLPGLRAASRLPWGQAAAAWAATPLLRVHTLSAASVGAEGSTLVQACTNAGVAANAGAPAATTDAAWAAEQALRAQACAAVVWWSPNLTTTMTTLLRRLHLAAQEGHTPLVVVRPEAAGALASPAPLRVKLSPTAPGVMGVHVLKRRGPVMAEPIFLDVLGRPGAPILAGPHAIPPAVVGAAPARLAA
jgi:protein ImuA